jgi:hypothetical protein
MRATVVLLLLANIGCFLWFAWWSPPTKPERPLPGGDLSPLANPMPVETRCFVLQPSPGLREGRAFAERLKAQGARVDWQPPETTTEYWVHRPPFADLAEARRAVETLRDNGYADAALATGRGWTNVAVVGIFDERAQAVQKRDAVRASGFSVHITRRQRAIRPGRLTLRASQPDPAPPGHRWVKRDCAR